MGLLKEHKAYLSGPMDRVKKWSDAIDWRKKIKNELWSMEIGVLDPCDKPTSGAEESPEWRAYITQLKLEGKFDEVAKEMKPVCRLDLRMVDVADFIIVYIDMNIHACGLYHEIFEGVKQRKPVLVMCKQDKSLLPNWLFGVLPHTDMFGNAQWQDLLHYLHLVDKGKTLDKTRWRLFDYNKIFGRKI